VKCLFGRTDTGDWIQLGLNFVAINSPRDSIKVVRRDSVHSLDLQAAGTVQLDL